MFPSTPGRHNNCGSLHKGFSRFSPHEFNNKFNTMLDAHMRDMPNFTGASPSSMRKSHLKSAHEVLSEVLKNKSPDFIVRHYYFQAVGFIESKFYKPFVQQTRKKYKKACVVLFLVAKVWSLLTLQEF